MKKILSIAALSLALAGQAFLATPAMHGQAISVNGGAITGNVTDNTGAAVPNASIKVTSPETGFTTSITSNSAGVYQVGPLNPGKYNLIVTAPGFSTVNVATVVRTGTATTGDVKLNIGSAADTIEVSTGDLQVNTEQTAVSDVLTQEQISKLPINGRNFLDSTQLEPGVILQSGESFDPTKAGYSAISVSGVSGRTTRILLDGQDITDETVGTTILNVTQGSVQEIQLNRANQDVSGEVTSTGAVLVSTRSGTNTLHGQAFYNFQDNRALFAAQKGQQVPFQRNQFGGSVGGPIIKDKLFFFANSERIQQRSSSSTTVVNTLLTTAGGPSIASAFPSVGTPYKETYTAGRIDWNGPFHGHYFARVAYNVNSVASNYGYGYWLYANRDNTPAGTFGADFSTTHFTHSFRGGYEKFHNLISDATLGNSAAYNGIPGFAFYRAAAGLYSGPNYLAPQETYQSAKQLRYDGSWTHGRHTVRFGSSLNRLLGGGYAAFYGLSPRASIVPFAGPSGPSDTTTLGCNAVAGAAACPNDVLHGYRVSTVVMGNGQGAFTENPGFKAQNGGVFSWRYAFYVQDSWKITPSLTLTGGLRYSVDTRRANQDLDTPTCADVDSSIAPAGCTSGSVKLFNLFSPGLGVRAKQPYNNLAPQAGFVFSPGSHKTSVHAGFGMFIESNVFNNQTNARSGLIKQGLFFDYQSVCSSYTLTQPDGTTLNTVGPTGPQIKDLCLNRTVLDAAPYFTQLQGMYKTNTLATGPQGNGGFVGNTLNATGLYSPFYTQPYSMQWSFGLQREIFKGAVITADYVHNSTLHTPQALDINHVGAARTFNAAQAANAIAKTNNAYSGCGLSASPAATACAIAAGAKITNYAANGLDSGAVYNGGNPGSYKGRDGTTNQPDAAFPGINPGLGTGGFTFPGGRSGYDALQVVYKQQKSHPAPGISTAAFQAAYSLSRIVTSSGYSSNGTSDQFFAGTSAWDNDNPTSYMGTASLDRRHQVTFGGSFTVKGGPQIGILGHFYSAPPTTFQLDTTATTVGQIFQTDVTGDGTSADPLPGQAIGSYMRDFKGGDLNKVIQKFNSAYAGKLTPAGQQVVNAGLLTQAQMVAIGGAVQQIAQTPSAKAFEPATNRAMDVNFSYPIRMNWLREGLNLEPAIAFYNVFNFSNFGTKSGTLLNTANAGPGVVTTGVCTTLPNSPCNGYVNGQNTPDLHEPNRVQRGSGTFSAGAPRQVEFQVKLNF